jgi:membrane protein implicated in regulation of membrane protease activity
MLEALDLLAGLVNILIAWRFFLPTGLAFGAWAASVALLPAGGPRLGLLVFLLVVGMAVGAGWQASHRRRRHHSSGHAD